MEMRLRRVAKRLCLGPLRAPTAQSPIDNSLRFSNQGRGEAGTFVAREPEYEGYWRATIDERSDLPWPTPDTEWTGRAVFLRFLDGIEAHAERIAYRGMSICRVCGRLNGHEGLRLAGWEWPAGYKHYIADHGVRPSLAFERYILGLTDDFTRR